MKTVLLFLFTVCYALPNMCWSQTNLLNGPEGISFHQPGKCYYVSNAKDGKIIRIDSLFNQTIFYEGFSVPMGVEIVGDSLFIASNDPSTISCINVLNGELAGSILIPESQSMGHMDIDKRTGFLYVIGQAGDVFKINTSTLSYNVFVDSGLPNNTQTCSVDTLNDCLYTFSWPTTYVRSVNLSDSSDIQSHVNPLTGSYIDCTKDNDGNIYVSSREGDKINKFQPGCMVVPEVFETDFEKPAGLTYNQNENLIAVCNYDSDSIDYIHLTTTGFDNNVDQHLATPIIYPNPVEIELNIIITGDIDEETNMIIYDISRQIVMNVRFIGNASSFNINDILPGIYFLRIESAGNIFHRKIIKL
jgi:type IX secretion system substrate protein